MGPFFVPPQPLHSHQQLPHRQGVRAMCTFTCGSSSACWYSCWRSSSSLSTGWRTSSPPHPLSPTSAAREGAPLPTWRSVASHLRGPPSPPCPPDGHGGATNTCVHVRTRQHACSHTGQSQLLLTVTPTKQLITGPVSVHAFTLQMGQCFRWHMDNIAHNAMKRSRG